MQNGNNLFTMGISCTKNEDVVKSLLEDVQNQCKTEFTSRHKTIEIACEKTRKLMEYFDQKYPFFTKTPSNTDICCIFAVIYDCFNKIYDLLKEQLELNEDDANLLYKLERMEVKSIRDMRNLIDNKYSSPKNHIETEILSFLEYLKYLAKGKKLYLGNEDCINIRVLIEILNADVKAIVEELTTNPSTILGKDYVIDIKPLEVHSLSVGRTIIDEADNTRYKAENKPTSPQPEIILENIQKAENYEATTSVDTDITDKEHIRADIDEPDVITKTEEDLKGQEDFYKKLLKNLISIDKNMTTYKEIVSSIEVITPSMDLSEVGMGIVADIKKTITQTVQTHILPLKKELGKECFEALTNIKQLQVELESYIEYINEIQNSLSIAV